MALTIRLEDKRGTQIEEVFDTGDVLLRAVHRQPVNTETNLLKYIDPYGDTIFNGLQAKDAVTEIERLRNNVSGAEVQTLDEIRDLAMKCAFGIHLFLKFYGD